jgi:hypothetical protein
MGTRQAHFGTAQEQKSRRRERKASPPTWIVRVRRGYFFTKRRRFIVLV